MGGRSRPDREVDEDHRRAGRQEVEEGVREEARSGGSEAGRSGANAGVTATAQQRAFAYVAFVTDIYSRGIVGWSVAATLRSEIHAYARHGRLERWRDLTGLTHHSDHCPNYMALVYTERIAELGAKPSTGTVGDSYDCEIVDCLQVARLVGHD